MAKAIQITGFDNDNYLDHIRLVDVPIPEPKEGQVLIQVILRPVNPTDVLLIRGRYGKEFPLPRVPGSEGLARVVKNGPGASKFEAGQRVVVVQWPQFTEGGSWTTHAVIAEKDLFAVPDSIDDKTAAQFYINPVTVYGMLKELAVPKGQWLLQTAAGSALGRQVISLAKHYGFKTINVVRRSAQAQELKDAGADEVICTDKEDIVERVKAITGGEGAYAALDAVGGKQAAQVALSLRTGGELMLYGMLDPEPLELISVDMVAKVKTLRAFIIYQWIEKPHKDAAVAEVMKLLEDKVIVPFVGETYPLEQFKEAIVKSQEVGHGAKIFLQG